jgi:hypothetical protein
MPTGIRPWASEVVYTTYTHLIRILVGTGKGGESTMVRKVRKQIVIDPAQEEALAALASERGVSQSELIRQALDELLQEAARAQATRDNHEALMAWFEQGMDLELTDENGKRTWTREDLYDNRGLPRHERDRLRKRQD